MRWVLAALWTAACLFTAFVVAGFVMMGDCAAPVDPCLAQQRALGWTVVGIGLIALVAGDWLIFRLRRD